MSGGRVLVNVQYDRAPLGLGLKLGPGLGPRLALGVGLESMFSMLGLLYGYGSVRVRTGYGVGFTVVVNYGYRPG